MTGVTGNDRCDPSFFRSIRPFSVLRPRLESGVRVVMFPSSTGEVTDHVTLAIALLGPSVRQAAVAELVMAFPFVDGGWGSADGVGGFEDQSGG